MEQKLSLSLSLSPSLFMPHMGHSMAVTCMKSLASYKRFVYVKVTVWLPAARLT